MDFAAAATHVSRLAPRVATGAQQVARTATSISICATIVAHSDNLIENRSYLESLFEAVPALWLEFDSLALDSSHPPYGEVGLKWSDSSQIAQNISIVEPFVVNLNEQIA